MGIKDTKAKEYFSDNRRFADLCNYILYQGEPEIDPVSLVEQDSTEVLSVFGAHKDWVYLQRWRDLLKSAVVKNAGDICIVLIGMEAQSDIHYAMPVKNMLYDAMNYAFQVKKAAKRHKAQKDKATKAEFLSGFYAADHLTPVLTLTIYLGDKEWDAPRKLFDMYESIDERLLSYLSDYNANVFVPKEIQDFSGFQTEIKQLFEVLKAAGDKEQMDRLLKSDAQFERLDNETVQAINVFADVNIPIEQKGQVTNMCKAWKDQFLDGCAQGRAQGRREGELEGRIQVYQNLRKRGFSKEEALSLADIPESAVEDEDDVTAYSQA